ncbi:MAG: hypothetical protein JRI80_19515 [Deltaproteobacteria bacterium]|nr:hypothetical protein [Deltaproteobacteria bacterium]
MKAARLLNTTEKEKEITVEYKTLEQYIEKDKKAYTRRLKKLVDMIGYKMTGEFKSKIVDGHVFPTTFVTTIIPN